MDQGLPGLLEDHRRLINREVTPFHLGAEPDVQSMEGVNVQGGGELLDKCLPLGLDLRVVAVVLLGSPGAGGGEEQERRDEPFHGL